MIINGKNLDLAEIVAKELEAKVTKNIPEILEQTELCSKKASDALRSYITPIIKPANKVQEIETVSNKVINPDEISKILSEQEINGKKRFKPDEIEDIKEAITCNPDFVENGFLSQLLSDNRNFKGYELTDFIYSTDSAAIQSMKERNLLDKLLSSDKVESVSDTLRSIKSPELAYICDKLLEGNFYISKNTLLDIQRNTTPEIQKLVYENKILDILLQFKDKRINEELNNYILDLKPENVEFINKENIETILKAKNKGLNGGTIKDNLYKLTDSNKPYLDKLLNLKHSNGEFKLDMYRVCNFLGVLTEDSSQYYEKLINLKKDDGKDMFPPGSIVDLLKYLNKKAEPYFDKLIYFKNDAGECKFERNRIIDFMRGFSKADKETSDKAIKYLEKEDADNCNEIADLLKEIGNLTPEQCKALNKYGIIDNFLQLIVDRKISGNFRELSKINDFENLRYSKFFFKEKDSLNLTSLVNGLNSINPENSVFIDKYNLPEKLKYYRHSMLSDLFGDITPERIRLINNNPVLDSLLMSKDVPDHIIEEVIRISPKQAQLLESFYNNPNLKHCVRELIDKPDYIRSLSDEVLKLEKISDFLNQENGQRFFKLFPDYKIDDTCYLTDIVEEHTKSQTEHEIDKFYNEMKYLLSCTDKHGDKVFVTNTAKGDCTEKKFLYGVKNLLNLRKTDPEKYFEMTELLKGIEQGKLPAYIFSRMCETGELLPSAVNVMKKTMSGEPIFPQYTSSVRVSEILKNTKLGDVVFIEDKSYINNGTRLIPYLDRNTFLTLLDPVELYVGQGQLGNCYDISGGFCDFLKNPKGRVKLYKMLKQDGNDIVVTIPGYDKLPVRFVDKKIKLPDGNQHLYGSLGMQMIEQAYARVRNIAEKSGKTDLNEIMQYIQGGLQSQVYDEYLGAANSKTYLPEDILEKLSEPESLKNASREELRKCAKLLEAHENNRLLPLKDKDDLVKTLIEYANNDNYLVSVDSEFSFFNPVFSPENSVYGSHAYSIESVDAKNKTIKIINPWNTAESVKISFDQFKNWFDTVCVAPI